MNQAEPAGLIRTGNIDFGQCSLSHLYAFHMAINKERIHAFVVPLKIKH